MATAEKVSLLEKMPQKVLYWAGFIGKQFRKISCGSMYKTYDQALSLCYVGRLYSTEIPICHMQSKTNGAVLDDND